MIVSFCFEVWGLGLRGYRPFALRFGSDSQRRLFDANIVLLSHFRCQLNLKP